MSRYTWVADLDPSDPFDRIMLEAVRVAQHCTSGWGLVRRRDRLRRALDAWDAEVTSSTRQVRERTERVVAELRAWNECGTDPIRLGC